MVRTMSGSVTASMTGKAVEMVTLLLLATVVPRALGPHDYGRFAVALTVVTICSLGLTLGGPTVMTRFVPAAPPAVRLALARRLGWRLARGRATQLVVIAVLAAGLVAVAPERFRSVEVAIVVVALALNVATTLLLQVLLGLGRTGPWSARYPLHNAVLVALVLLFYPMGGSSAALAAILGAAATTAAFAGVVARSVLFAGDEPKVELPAGAMRFGAFQAAGAALTQFTHRGGVIVAAILGGSSAETGFAALAIGLSLGATYAVLQTFTVSLPFLIPSGEAAVTDGEESLRRLARGLLAVLIPACVIAAAALDTWVPAVFGNAYRSSVTAFIPALAVVVLAPIGALCVQVSALRLRPETSLYAGLAAAIAFIGTAVATVPAGGATGALTSTLVGIAVGLAVSVIMLPGSVPGTLALSTVGGAIAVVLAGAL